MPGKNIIGIDLGGTKCAIARFSNPAMIQEEYRQIPTRAHDGFSAVLDDIVEVVMQMRTPETSAIGIGVPGLVRQPDGILLNAPNISDSKNIPVKQILEERLKLPVFVGNDANCFVLAEARLGSATGYKTVIGITFGTGVGGGIVINGNLFEGAHGYAAEIGHMLMIPGHPPFETQDKRGEVEQFLSGTAMGKRCTEASTPEDYLEGAVCSFMQPEIFREVAWLCTNLIYLLDPDVIVFGGSAGYALTKHIDEIHRELLTWTLPNTPLPVIVAATTKNAGVVGAALLALPPS